MSNTDVMNDSRHNSCFSCVVLQNCSIGYSLYSYNFQKWHLVIFELLLSVRKYEDLMTVFVNHHYQHLVLVSLQVYSRQSNRSSEGWTQPAAMWIFFFNSIIWEGALSHDLDLDQPLGLVLLQGPWALAAGSLALEHWDWAMPAPRPSAGSHLYRLTRALS